MFDAVIFDMDGLLIDSEHVGIEAAMHACELQGLAAPYELVLKTIGITTDSSRGLYLKALPTLDFPQMKADFTDYMHSRAEAKLLPLKDGAIELLDTLRQKGIPCAIASSSPEETVRLYLTSTGILQYFSALACGGSGLKSKPAPDIFLAAAQRLQVSPESCLALEDSVNGVKAARAAGMRVCMVPDVIPYDDTLAQYCDHVLRSLRGVPALLDA